jgi:hypothetical protein
MGGPKLFGLLMLVGGLLLLPPVQGVLKVDLGLVQWYFGLLLLVKGLVHFGKE